MNIYLVDNVNNGHHNSYEKCLLKISNTKSLNERKEFIDFKKNVFKAIYGRKVYIDLVNKIEQQLIHFLYLDSLYKTPWLLRKVGRNNKLIGTLHWYPKRKVDMYLLKKSSKYFKYIIVHSDYIRDVLKNNGINNVLVIEYPSFNEDNIEIIQKEANFTDRIIVSCIGGTRADKGLNILIDSFKYLSEESKSNIQFNVVGKEEDIKYYTLINESNSKNINITTVNRILSDREYWQNIINSDVILLPYTNEFRGNSGPMTDGAYCGKFILAADRPSLKYLVDKYKLGMVFKAEDSFDLASKLNDLNKMKFNRKIIVNKNFSMDGFKKKHEIIYKKIINEENIDEFISDNT